MHRNPVEANPVPARRPARFWPLAPVIALNACGPSPYPLDDLLRLNHLQAKGTHNSYHLEPEEPFDDSHRYSHAPLDVQLREQGVRQFELDVHRSARGHFEIFHLPGGIDDLTTCRRFTECLETIKTWSDANPDHLPIMIWLEPKDEDLDWADENYALFLGEYEALEAEILSVWPPARIITPDEVRGSFATLPQALRTQGWPVLGAVRGRVIFAMLDSGAHRDAYLEGAPALEGRLMFVHAKDPEAAHAAMFKVNNATSNPDRTLRLLTDGFIITSNIDGAELSLEDNRARSQGSLTAGAHFLSSDFPAPVEGREYWIEVPDGTPARCNPVTAPPECTSMLLENLTR